MRGPNGDLTAASSIAANCKLITAIVPMERQSAGAIRTALREQGAFTVTTHESRGFLPGAKRLRGGLPLWIEMEIIQAIVPTDRAQTFFDLARQAGRITEPGGGLLLLGDVAAASHFQLPALPPET